jgi:hypothetical protein
LFLTFYHNIVFWGAIYFHGWYSQIQNKLFIN